MSGRTELANKLKEALPTWQIVSNAVEIDSVRKPGAIVVWTQRRKRVEVQGFDMLTDEVTLWVLSGVDAVHIEDELDDLLEEVLAVIETFPEFTWDEAERGVLMDKHDGWKVTVTCTFQINDN